MSTSLPAYFLLTATRSGTSTWQGGHHVAKKLSMMTLPLFLARRSINPARLREGTDEEGEADEAAKAAQGNIRQSKRGRMIFFIWYLNEF